MDRQPKIAKKEQTKQTLFFCWEKKIVKVDEYELFSQLHQKTFNNGKKM